MPNFVDDPVTLPNKSDLAPLPGGADPDEYMSAADYQQMRGAFVDLRQRAIDHGAAIDTAEAEISAQGSTLDAHTAELANHETRIDALEAADGGGGAPTRVVTVSDVWTKILTPGMAAVAMDMASGMPGYPLGEFVTMAHRVVLKLSEPLTAGQVTVRVVRAYHLGTYDYGEGIWPVPAGANPPAELGFNQGVIIGGGNVSYTDYAVYNGFYAALQSGPQANLCAAVPLGSSGYSSLCPTFELPVGEDPDDWGPIQPTMKLEVTTTGGLAPSGVKLVAYVDLAYYPTDFTP
jgi:hypothetical protein